MFEKKNKSILINNSRFSMFTWGFLSQMTIIPKNFKLVEEVVFCKTNNKFVFYLQNCKTCHGYSYKKEQFMFYVKIYAYTNEAILI